ncbi:MAG: hypothetical protein ACREDS_08815 [Limisphaerales bacterium]
MSEELANRKRLPVAIALLLSLWCGLIAAFNACFWFHNTWGLFSALGWRSFVLLVNPTAYFWFFPVSSCWYIPLRMVFTVWDAYFGSIKIILLAIIVPIILTLLFSFPQGWYPIQPAQGGGVWLRFLPFL